MALIAGLYETLDSEHKSYEFVIADIHDQCQASEQLPKALITSVKKPKTLPVKDYYITPT